jgi:electron-transferring-flavoprotein dehydrogenase
MLRSAVRCALAAPFRRRLSSEAGTGLRAVTSAAREKMEYDVLVVGAGPAGLSAAVRLKQKSPETRVCVVEKGPEVGAHILSGNVFVTRALDELIPDWKSKEAPIHTAVSGERFLFLTERRALPLPVPKMIDNHGNYVISLGRLTRWLAKQAEELGVEIYPGFSASEVLYHDDGGVAGVATGDVGIGKDGKPKDSFARGMELRAKQTLLAEGARGSLSEEVMARFKLRAKCDPQTYGIGLKEVWRVDKSKHRPGFVQHTIGWPLDWRTYGGSFVYHMEPDLVLVGLVIGLDYANPYLNPYMEFQRFKHHPLVASVLDGGERISYGARVLNEGGLQSIPKLTFKGGMLLGCSAGFMNVPRIKGTHYAMKSGILAADTISAHLAGKGSLADGAELSAYDDAVHESYIHQDLHVVRNCHPAFKWGLIAGMMHTSAVLLVTKGREPWTLRNRLSDAERTQPAHKFKPINYPKPDGKLSFDILTSVQLTGTMHEEDQPSHLRILPELAHVPKDVSMQVYAAPESRFCPAKVYEYVEDESKKPKLVINAQNCIHCKTCDIKTPRNYIKWTVPQGGEGPRYGEM